jgi:hypothetical protein
MANLVEDRSQPLNDLRLKVVLPENGDDDPRVSILVDGTDRLRHVGRAGWRGFGPAELFDSKDVLVPGEIPRRVAIYQCSCGDPGCGSLAPVIERGGKNQIKWTDFQDFTGVFDGPVTLNDPETGDPFADGILVAAKDLVFDRQAYEAEVLRAMADRSWESDGRKTARLLQGLMKDVEITRLEAAGIELVGVTFNWFSTKGPSWNLELRPTQLTNTRHRLKQTLLTLKTVKAPPEVQANSLLDRLQSTPVSKWASQFPFRP